MWDRLTHIVGYTVNNYTADVTNNDYFMYKEGQLRDPIHEDVQGLDD